VAATPAKVPRHVPQFDSQYTQARIRVNKEGALEMRVALERYDEFLRDAREISIAARPNANRKLTAVRRVIAELERTIEEHGWGADDEPERSDP